MKTKTSAWLFGFLHAVIIFVMVFGLLGNTPLRSVHASLEPASKPADAPPVDFDPTGKPSDEAQYHPYTLPDSAARFERPAPAADRSAANYQPDRLPAVMEDLEQPVLPDFIPPAAPAGISPDVSYAFAVDVFYDVVWAWGFPAEKEITLTVGPETYVRTTNTSGEAEWSDLGHDFVDGETITLTSGVFTKSHTVKLLALTKLDPVLDIVKGTTKPGAVVNVGALDAYDNWVSVDVTANLEGVFKVNMALLGVDLVPGTSGNIGRWDSDGDGTIINWSVPNPRFGVNLNRNYIWATEWTPGNPVTVTVDASAIPATDVHSNGEFWFDTPDILPGQVVIVSDGISIKTLVVTTVTVTSVNADTDTITGTATPGSEIYVDGIDGPILVNGAGVWTGYFAWDLQPGAEGYARQIDTDDDWTEFYWYAPNPMIDVRPDDDVVQGWQFLPETEVEISVGGNIYYQVTGSDGYFDTGVLDYDIQTDDLVVVNDGTYTKDHNVYPSALTGYDVDADTLTGIAAPNREVGAWACMDDVCDGLTTTTDGSGNWTLDFSGVMDIVPNMEGGLWQSDDEDDDTVTHWRVPDPWIGVNVNNNFVWCDQWPTNASVTLFVDGVEISTIDLDYWGDGGFWSVETEVGQEVTVTGGGFTKSTIVQNITLGGVDQYADTVFGTADAGTELEIWAWNDYESIGGAMYTTADGSGNWLIDFSANWDIKPGWYGYAQIHDAEDDFTEVSWNIPMPWMRVYIDLDEICAYQWTPGSVVTVTVDDYSNTMMANENGEFCSGYVGFDIVPGDYVEMTDGFTTKSHTTYDIVLSGYDLDLDTLYGTTEPFSWIHGAACNNGECNDSFYDESIGASGEWLLDFSGIVDIQPGTEGWIDKGDDDNDFTFIDWRVPRPIFVVNLNENRVWCNHWTANATLTLNIDGVDVATAEADFWGHAEFFDFDIQPGQIVKVRDGTYEKVHNVQDLTVINVDYANDSVNGTAPFGSIMNVRACNSETCEYVFPEVSIDNTWVADFSGLWDLVSGNEIFPQIRDDDRDYTELRLWIPKPWLVVGPEEDFARGHDIVPGSTVSLKIGTYSGSLVDDDYDGFVYFDLASVPFDILPGQTAELSDGTTTMTHTVRNIAFTGYDLTTDKVSGTATAGSDVFVYAYDGVGDGSGVWATADATGKWTADFQGLEDISVVTWGWVDQHDNEGDYTTVNWHIPAPVYPAYLEKLTTSKVTFDWEDTPGATEYKIQLSTNKDFSFLLLNVATVDSLYPYASKLAFTTKYFWRVKAKIGGVWTSWNPVWKFTSMDPLAAPVLLYPTPKQIITDDNTPLLDWEPVVNGVTYLVQISTLVDFSTKYHKATIGETEYETPVLPNGRYFWRVRAIDASGGKGPWSEVRIIKIALP